MDATQFQGVVQLIIVGQQQVIARLTSVMLNPALGPRVSEIARQGWQGAVMGELGATVMAFPGF